MSLLLRWVREEWGEARLGFGRGGMAWGKVGAWGGRGRVRVERGEVGWTQALDEGGRREELRGFISPNHTHYHLSLLWLRYCTCGDSTRLQHPTPKRDTPHHQPDPSLPLVKIVSRMPFRLSQSVSK